MMGLGKAKLHAKLDFVSSIDYGNISEFFTKIWDHKNGEAPYFGQTDFTIEVADHMIPIQSFFNQFRDLNSVWGEDRHCHIG